MSTDRRGLYMSTDRRVQSKEGRGVNRDRPYNSNRI